MKIFPLALANYFTANKTHIEETFLWIKAKDRATGDIVPVGLWDGDQNVTVNVINPSDGSLESRLYLGMGRVLDIPAITDTAGTEIRNLSISLSGVSSTVQNLVKGYDVRAAPIEIHKSYRDEATMLPLSVPEAAWVGFINGAEINEAAIDLAGGAGSDSTVVLSCVSHIRELTRTNSQMRCLDASLERSGDQFFKYADSAGFVVVEWGKVKKSHADHPHTRHRRKTGGPAAGPQE